MSRWSPTKPDTGVVVYGASDDLIEIDGQITDEVGAYEAEKFLVFPDGTLAEIRFDTFGVWRINVITQGTNLGITFDPCPTDVDGDPGFDRHTDALYIPGHVPWVAVVDPEAIIR